MTYLSSLKPELFALAKVLFIGDSRKAGFLKNNYGIK
jgi:hypothetical protein